MSSEAWPSRRVMLRNSLVLFLTGCGRKTEVVPVPSDEQGLKELAKIYRDFVIKRKPPPKSLKELGVKGQQNPNAVAMINSGDLVVHWGASPSPEGTTADAILAYLKTVPEQGGNVLMQDAMTIKMMTAEEFKATPKASPR
jgi:hypothetical protein